MTILSIQTDSAGQVDVTPRTIRITTNDTLATITSLNYLYTASLQGYTFNPTDVFYMTYMTPTFTSVTEVFVPSFTVVNGIRNIILVQVVAPVSTANGLTAHSGGGQTNALPLPAEWNRVTTVAAGNDSVLLPASIPGTSVVVVNAAASNSMNVFAQGNDLINALTATTAFAMAANKTAIFYCVVAGQWNSILTA